MNNRWFVCLMLELPQPEPKYTAKGRQVGIDIGLKALAALSTGELIDNPRWLRENLAKLRRLQRHAARQVKSSHRQRKTFRQIARLHEQIANQRADYLHKVNSQIIAE